MQGLLNKTRCYLSGHMEYGNGRAWREDVKQRLEHTGIIFLDPYHKPFATSQPEDEEARKNLGARKAGGTPEDFDFLNSYMRQVRSDDLRLCDVADFAIVNITPEIPSWGTAEELTTLNRQKKPIFLSVQGGKKFCPLWIFGMLNHKYIHDSVDEIIETLNGIDNNSINIDSTRWRLLLPEIR